MLSLINSILDSPNGTTRRPVLRAHFESNIPGLHIIGDLAGAPVVKLAMEQGSDLADYLAIQPDAKSKDLDCWDIIIAGAGAAGLNAALVAQDHGLRVLVLEKSKIANTIEDFPEGKWVYAEPISRASKGKLWLEGASKEDLLAKWNESVSSNNLNIHAGEGVVAIKRTKDERFEVETDSARYLARRFVLATGQRGTPRKLEIPGEEQDRVHHRLYNPKKFKNQQLIVVGGGNSAVEAALALAEQNDVSIIHRGTGFSRIFADNRRKLDEAILHGRINVLFESQVKRINPQIFEVEKDGKLQTLAYDHAFLLIGAELPTKFLRSMGIQLENDWTGNPLTAACLALLTLFSLWIFGGKSNLPALDGFSAGFGLLALLCFAALIWLAKSGNRYASLALSFLICYTIYGVKSGDNAEFWPFHGWGHKSLSFLNRPWSFWYTVIYSSLMTIFGVQAIKRWGIAKKDKFQIWRYVSLISFQWIFFFLIPEFLFQYAVKYQWVGEALARDPQFSQNAWRSYGIIYAWPLFFYTFLGAPHKIWIVWGALLSFVIIPLLVLFHGKRYCSWICGCGGLAETFGDRWRHLAPKGNASIKWEKMNAVILLFAVVVTVLLLLQDFNTLLREPARLGLEGYHLIADVWLVGILPVTLYPFFGGKVWCRYWCPLAKMMQIFSSVFTRFKVSRFAIQSNDKCISCGECTRNCQVGIDVMNFAAKQQQITNFNTTCIGCGICVTVCPMDVLSFAERAEMPANLVQIKVQ